MKTLVSILEEARGEAFNRGWREASTYAGEVEEARIYEAEQEGYARGWRQGCRTTGVVAVVIFFILTVLF